MNRIFTALIAVLAVVLVIGSISNANEKASADNDIISFKGNSPPFITDVGDTCCDFDFAFTYQGVMKDSSTGDPANGSFNFIFSIIDSLSNELYAESTSINVVDGLFNHQVGSLGSLDPMIFSCPNLFQIPPLFR